MTKKHTFLMIACCLVPLAGLTAIYLFGVPVNSVFAFGMILLCPLLHFVLMRGMMGHKHHQVGHSHPTGSHNPAPVPEKVQWIAGESEEPLR